MLRSSVRVPRRGLLPSKLYPGSRPPEDKPGCGPHLFGELALSDGAVADLEETVRGLAESGRVPARRTGHNDPFLREEAPDRGQGGDEVAIGGNEHRRIERVLESVLQQFHRDVHVRHLFLREIEGKAAVPATARTRQIVPEVDAHIMQGLDCFDVAVLAPHLYPGVG